MLDELSEMLKEFEKVNALKERAESGDPQAQCEIADMYRKGYGTEQDFAEAMKWYRKAAEQGNPDAMYNLGVMYYYGDGAEKDLNEAFKWYEKAAENGEPLAIINLAAMYVNGQGCKKDQKKAFELYKKAADLGDAGGMLYLGKCYFYGIGVETDLTKANEWLLKANARAQETGSDWVMQQVNKLLPQTDMLSTLANLTKSPVKVQLQAKKIGVYFACSFLFIFNST